MLRYLKDNEELELRLEAKDTGDPQKLAALWHADAAFAVHADMKSHTGGTHTLGKGSLQTISSKQKLNTTSSTEAELVAAHEITKHLIWSMNFLKEQGYETKPILYQDNTSAILLEEYGAKSVGKRSRHLNIRYFWIKDQLDQELMEVNYCPTEEMVADFPSKPLQGKQFKLFRKIIMNLQE